MNFFLYLLISLAISLPYVLTYVKRVKLCTNCYFSCGTICPYHSKVQFGLGLFTFAFYSIMFLPSSFFLFLFFTRSWIHVGDRPTSGSHALCTRPTSTLDVHTLVWNGTICGSHALFMGPTNIFFHPNFN